MRDENFVLYVSRSDHRNVAVISSTDKEFCERLAKWAEADGYRIATIPPELDARESFVTRFIGSDFVGYEARLVDDGRPKALAAMVRKIFAYLGAK